MGRTSIAHVSGSSVLSVSGPINGTGQTAISNSKKSAVRGRHRPAGSLGEPAKGDDSEPSVLYKMARVAVGGGCGFVCIGVV